MDDAPLGMPALKSMPLFAGVTEHDLGNILAIGQLRSFEPGQAIVERDQPADALYIVLRGLAGVDAGGSHHELGAGDFFGEMALIAGGKRTATVRAVERVETLRIGAKEFQGFLLQQPRVGLAILRSIVDRLREAQERIDAWSGLG
jgi:CRP-like cAMP-binding protein